MSSDPLTHQPPSVPKRDLFRLAALFVSLVVADILIATVVRAPDSVGGGLVAGAVFAQVVLAATWTALGPLKLFSRIASGAVMAVLIGFTLVSCIRNSNAGVSERVWFSIVITQWSVIQIPLWVMHVRFGMRIVHVSGALKFQRSLDQPVRKSVSELQFGIRQLLAWTTLLGIVFGLGRWMLLTSQTNTARHGIVIYCLVLCFNCLLAWPIVWLTLSRLQPAISLTAMAVCCLGLTVAEISALQSATGFVGHPEFIWLLNVIQGMLCFGVLMVVRHCGFQLVRSV